jgi:hypothetical protein
MVSSSGGHSQHVGDDVLVQLANGAQVYFVQSETANDHGRDGDMSERREMKMRIGTGRLSGCVAIIEWTAMRRARMASSNR